MPATEDVDRLIERYHLAFGEFLKGDPEPFKKLWSHKEDVSSANPHGPPVRGWDEVALALEHAASLRSEGEFLGYEVVAKVVTPELAYVVRIERAQAKIGASEEITPYAVRSTMIFRALRALRRKRPLDFSCNRGYSALIALFTKVVEMTWIPRALRRTVPGRPSLSGSGRRSGSG